MSVDYEFYETPAPFSRFLFQTMGDMGVPIQGQILEPCVGDSAIIDAVIEMPYRQQWITNDLDRRWVAEHHMDATKPYLWSLMGNLQWTVSNPPFTPALDIIEPAIRVSSVGVAMHMRASIHEVLKTGTRRTWMNRYRPTGILWLPRFAYQRSKTTGQWTTDSVCACWCVWLKDPAVPQFIRYAGEDVIDALDAFTPNYRDRMDRLMGYTGSEAERRKQRVA